MCVDEVPPSETDYIDTTIIDAEDLYTLEDCPAEVGPIAVAIPQYWGSATGTPTINHIKPLLRIDGVTYEEDELAIPSSFSLMQSVLESSPASLTVFTAAEINGLEFGLKAKT